MSSYSKTVDSYEGFVQLCSGYGGYNPGSPNLQLNALRELSGQARDALEAMQEAKSKLAKASNDREATFAGLSRLASGVSFALAASGASEQTMKDVRALLRQMTSRKKYRAPLPAGAEAEPVETRTFSQRGYEAMVNHFLGLVKLVEQEPNYRPHEVHLQLGALLEMVERLQALNQAVRVARANFGHARLSVRQVFYGTGTSLVTTARNAKKYLRSVFGFNSGEYRQVRKFQFSKSGE